MRVEQGGMSLKWAAISTKQLYNLSTYFVSDQVQLFRIEKKQC